MKNKGLLFLLTILLIGNIVWAYLYLANHRSNQRGGNRMREQFMKEMGFTKQQASDFEKLRNDQRNSAQPMMDSMHQLKKQYIQAMINGAKVDSIQQTFATELGKKMIAMDYKLYQDLSEAKKICTPEQYAKYDSLIIKNLLRTPGKHKNK